MIVNRFEQDKMDPYLRKFELERLKPPSEAYDLKWREDQMFILVENKQRKRKVYFNTPLENEEVKMIRSLEELLVKHDLVGKFSDPALLKQIYAAKMNIKQAAERVVSAYEWLTNPSISSFTYQTRQQLQKGFVYTFGHSIQYRPIIMIRPDLIDFESNYENSLYVIFYICQRYRMIPYHVEKVHLILDLNHMKVSEIPFKKIYHILTKIGIVYCENSQKIFVLNSSGIGSIWSVVKRFMREDARQRVMFVQSFTQLNQFIAPDQRELKYGGTCPNLTSFWPPSMPGTIVPQIPKENVLSLRTVQNSLDESFYSVMNNPDYFGILEAEEPERKCSCSCVLF